METESQKMLGYFDGEVIETLDMVVSATCTRVPVLDGHLVNISVELDEGPALSSIMDDWTTWQAADIRFRACPARLSIRCSIWIASTARSRGVIVTPATA